MKRLKEAEVTPLIRIANNMTDYLRLHDIKEPRAREIEKALGESLSQKRVQEVGRYSIDPEETGPISPIFTTIKLEISVSVYQPSGESYMKSSLHLNYDYEHPNGSNGVRLTFRSSDNFETYSITS